MSYKFCVHEKHGGFCERKRTFCNPACPYGEIKELAPVVHGTWVPTESPFMNECEDCSVCGYRTVWGHRYNYCPHCGAKMDGGAEDAF